jgi:uncharacterized membrane protein
MSNITKDSERRQAQINEWYYQYRLDTLFVLQLLFLGLSVILLFTVLSKYRIISPVFVMYGAAVVLIMVFIVWYFKYTYNKNTRDFYAWDKRRFPGDGTTSSISMEVRAAMNDILSKCK